MGALGGFKLVDNVHGKHCAPRFRLAMKLIQPIYKLLLQQIQGMNKWGSKCGQVLLLMNMVCIRVLSEAVFSPCNIIASHQTQQRVEERHKL